MALSNYAAAAWDERGRPVIARMCFGDIRVELYKTYVAIADEGAWREGELFTRPWVINVYEGCMEYRRLRIVAERARPQYGIFFYVYDVVSERMMLGIGVYGFIDQYECRRWEEVGGEKVCVDWEDKWVGISTETFQEFLEWLRRVREEKHWHWFWMPRPPEIRELWYYNQGTLYLIEKLTKKEIDENVLRRILAEKEMRKKLENPLF